MSVIIALALIALALVFALVALVSRVMLADEAQIVADSEGEPEVLPTLTSSLDARLFTARPMRAVVPPTHTQVVEIGAMPIEAYRTIAPAPRHVATPRETEKLIGVQPNLRAVIAAQPTMVLDAPDEIAPPTPALADTLWARDTQIDPSPYGQGRDPKTGRKRGANGRFIRE